MTSTYTSQILSAIPTYCPSCPPSLVLALVNTESGGNQTCAGTAGSCNAQGTLQSTLADGSPGALGLFQLMPATAAGLNVDPNAAAGNIQGGLTLLQQLYSQYGNWTEALEAYNQGSGSLAAQIAAGQTPVSAGYASTILNQAGIASSLGTSPDSSTSSDSSLSSASDSSDVLDSLSSDTGLSDTTLAIGAAILVALGLWMVS
jgi:hypothetical protein